MVLRVICRGNGYVTSVSSLWNGPWYPRHKIDILGHVRLKGAVNLRTLCQFGSVPMIPQTWLYTPHAIFSRSAGVGMTAASAMVDVLVNKITKYYYRLCCVWFKYFVAKFIVFGYEDIWRLTNHASLTIRTFTWLSEHRVWDDTLQARFKLWRKVKRSSISSNREKDGVPRPHHSFSWVEVMAWPYKERAGP